MATLKTAFKTQSIQPIDWKADDTRTLKLDDGVFSPKCSNRAKAKMATLQLNHIHEPQREEGMPAEWLLAFNDSTTENCRPLFISFGPLDPYRLVRGRKQEWILLTCPLDPYG